MMSLKKMLFIIMVPFILWGASKELEPGFQYLENQAYDKAVTFFENASNTSSDTLQVGLGLARAYTGMGDFKKAEALLLSLQSKYYGEPQIPEDLEQVYRQSLSVVTTQQDSLQLYSKIARMYEDMDPQISLAAYKSMVAIKPDWDYPYLRMGLLLYFVGMDTAYVDYYRKAIQYNTPSLLPYLHIAGYYVEIDELQQARDMALKAVEKGLGQLQTEKKEKIDFKLENNNGAQHTQEKEDVEPVLYMAIDQWLELLPEQERQESLVELQKQFPKTTILKEYIE